MPQKLIVLLSIFLSLNTFAQKPKLLKWYINDQGFPFGYDHLTLSSDSIFFYTASTENGCYLAKGNWKIKKNKLYLNSWDSIRAYPKLHIDFIKGSDTNNVIIKSFDYFGDPITGLSLGLIKHNQRDISNAEIVFADSLGQFLLSKLEVEGFFLIYQFYNSSAFKYDSSIQSYKLEPYITQINIDIQPAAAGALDRGIYLINLGNGIFDIREDGLYSKGKRIYQIHKR